MPDDVNRRRFLAAAGATAFGLLGGCAERFVPPSVPSDGTGTPGADGGFAGRDGDGEFSEETRSRAGELGRTVRESVVKLTEGRAGGTGWVVGDGRVLTNSHVVAEFETMRVETFDGRTGMATRVGYHRDLSPDIALLETDVRVPEALSTDPDADVSRGDPVVMVGHPGRVGDWVISLGTYHSQPLAIDWVLADVPADNGNSGSPLLTLDGSVIGCVSGTTSLGSRDGRADRPDEVYTSFPEEESLATATPAGTIERWVDEWT